MWVILTVVAFSLSRLIDITEHSLNIEYASFHFHQMCVSVTSEPMAGERKLGFLANGREPFHSTLCSESFLP